MKRVAASPHWQVEGLPEVCGVPLTCRKARNSKRYYFPKGHSREATVESMTVWRFAVTMLKLPWHSYNPLFVVYFEPVAAYCVPKPILCSVLYALFAPLRAHRIVLSILGIGDQTFANY